MVHFAYSLATAAALAAFATAHPGEVHSEIEIQTEIAKRNVHASHIARGLAQCAGNANYHALQARAANRRLAKAEHLRRKRSLAVDAPFKARRDLTALESFEAKNHNLTTSDYTTSTSASTLFANYKNVSCILTPEVTFGPYYVSGELVRSDVVDGQEGVAVHLEYQYIDVSTCEPVSGLYVDTWQANATGVYSGVEANGNGNGDQDPGNLNNTFLRGLQATDDDGVAAFDTIFAGHYAGRATHIHLMAHHGVTVLANNTIQGGNITHVGQIFFQEELKDAVEATAPYNTNTQSVTSNDQDTWAPDEADNNYDPFPDYVYLGAAITDGLLMWISVGVDLSANYTVSLAAEYTADGGISESGSMGGTGASGGNATISGGTPPGTGNMTMSGNVNGTAPTGTMGGSPPGSSGTETAAATSVTASTSTGTTTTKSATASHTASSSVATYSSSSASELHSSSLVGSLSTLRSVYTQSSAHSLGSSKSGVSTHSQGSGQSAKSAPSGSAPSGIPSGSKPSGSAPSGLPSGFAPSGSAPAGLKPSGSAHSGSAPSVPAPSGSKPSGSAQSGLPSGAKPSGSAPLGSAPSELPSGAKPSGAKPSGSAPSGSAPSGVAPSGSVPFGSAPSGMKANSQKPTHSGAKAHVHKSATSHKSVHSTSSAH